MPYYLAIQNIVRSFANRNKEERRIGVKEKQYTTEQEQIARFAKAMGHPARMAILAFLAKQEIVASSVIFTKNCLSLKQPFRSI